MAEPRLKPYVPIAALAEALVPDRVFMHDLVLDVEIGVYTHEKGATQRVRFSVDVDLLPAKGQLEDDLRALRCLHATVFVFQIERKVFDPRGRLIPLADRLHIDRADYLCSVFEQALNQVSADETAGPTHHDFGVLDLHLLRPQGPIKG